MSDKRSTLKLLSIDNTPNRKGIAKVFLKTTDGIIPCVYHETTEGNAAVIFVGGVGGGWNGPAERCYERWACNLFNENISSLRLDYRNPGDLIACVLDTLLGLEFLKSKGKTKIVLVGHSFGGAVVIQVGIARRSVIGVAALCSQTYGTNGVNKLSPCPLLLIHGKADVILPYSCSVDIYQRASEPKKIILYENCNHVLDECKDKLDKDFLYWLKSIFS